MIAANYINSQYNNTNIFARNKFLLGITEIWTTSLINASKDMEACLRISLELGDFEYAVLGVLYSGIKFFSGIPLFKFKNLLLEAVAIIYLVKKTHGYNLSNTLMQLLITDYWLGDKCGVTEQILAAI